LAWLMAFLSAFAAFCACTFDCLCHQVMSLLFAIWLMQVAIFLKGEE